MNSTKYRTNTEDGLYAIIKYNFQTEKDTAYHIDGDLGNVKMACNYIQQAEQESLEIESHHAQKGDDDFFILFFVKMRASIVLRLLDTATKNFATPNQAKRAE